MTFADLSWDVRLKKIDLYYFCLVETVNVNNFLGKSYFSIRQFGHQGQQEKNKEKFKVLNSAAC